MKPQFWVYYPFKQDVFSASNQECVFRGALAAEEDE